MKNLKRTLVLACLGLYSTIHAQNFNGIATYKSKQNIQLDIDTAQMQGMGTQIMDMLRKQFEKDFVLEFNQYESLYKEDKALEAPQPAGMVMMIEETGGASHIYKNTKEKRYVNQSESFGKLFLIKDKLHDLDWKLLNETKTIGQYKCYKATLEREVEVMESQVMVNPTEEEQKLPEPKKKTIEIVAWYAPDIPVNAGPEEFYGLPGLILQLENDEKTIICSKITLNPKTTIEIKEPTKGKIITQEKYRAVMEKKMKQIQENSPHFGGDGDGEVIEIRIGQ